LGCWEGIDYKYDSVVYFDFNDKWKICRVNKQFFHKGAFTVVNSKILVVTNEKMVANNLREILEKMGYRVVGIVTSNDEVLARIEKTRPDIILTDIRLNEATDGIKTGELIHSTYNTPIIYITGSAGENTIQRARSTGPFGYIFEPFDGKQIYAMVETALLRHQLEMELQEGRRWLNAVLDGISDGVIALDNQGAIKFINPIASQLTGWSEIEAIGRTLYEVFTLIDESSHERVEVSGANQSLNQQTADCACEGLLQSKSGTTMIVKADLSILKDQRGMAAGLVLVFRDITSHRESLKEIQRQSRRAEALVETAASLNTKIELSTVLNTICDVSNQALNAHGTGIFLQNTRQDTFSIRMKKTSLEPLRKFTGMDFEIPGSILRSLLSEKNPVTIISDLQGLPNVPYLELFKECNIHTVIVAGLYRQQDLIGVLASIYVGDYVRLPEDSLIFFKGLAAQAVVSISNASLFEQVRRGRERQKALTTRLVEIQETERRHIARELHDQIGQTLTGLQFMLEASKNQTGETYKNQLNDAQEMVSGLIGQIREMSLNLRPAMLDDIGLLPTLLWHYERFTKQTGIKVSYHHGDLNSRLSPDVETAVYRIIQEALTNIARHAQVAEAFVQLTLRNNILGVEITDHGLGFNPSVDTTKWSTAGLSGMRERANMLGGYLVVKSAPNEGTQILITIPLDLQPMERRNSDRKTAVG
jgi:PAS domain S-box-containing protein